MGWTGILLMYFLSRFPGVAQELQEEEGIQYRFQVYESIEH